MDDILYIIFTYTRQKALEVCLSSLFGKNDTRPSNVVIINDAGHQEIRDGLYSFCKENNFDYFCMNQNKGYGNCFNLAISLAELYNKKYVNFVESDYMFDAHGIDKIFDIFENNEYGQKAIAFSSMDNPDFYDKHKTQVTFPQILKDNFGDIKLNWDILWKPFRQETKYGPVYLEKISNSCGSMVFDWSKMMEIKSLFPKEYEFWKNITCDMQKPFSQRNLSDGCESLGAWWLWDLLAKYKGWDTNKYSGLLSIKGSPSTHLNGGQGRDASINGFLVAELNSFTHSPSYELTFDQVTKLLEDTDYYNR